MNTRNLVVLLIFIGYFSGNAQNKKDVLLTINSNPIYSSDFTKVFNKNLDFQLTQSPQRTPTHKPQVVKYLFKKRLSDLMRKQVFLNLFLQEGVLVLWHV